MDQAVIHVGGNMVIGKAGLAEGTNANTIKTVTAVVFTIDGKYYSKSATDNIAMTALAAQAADTTALYAVWINSSGTVSLTKEKEVLSTAISNGQTALPTVAPRVDYALLGLMKIVTVAVTFTSGSTDLSASGVTATFIDTMLPPSKTGAI